MQLLIRAIGRRAAKHVGVELRRISSRFVDATGATVVQVVTERRSGFGSQFSFIISASQMRQLSAATEGYLALGPVGQHMSAADMNLPALVPQHRL